MSLVTPLVNSGNTSTSANNSSSSTKSATTSKIRTKPVKKRIVYVVSESDESELDSEEEERARRERAKRKKMLKFRVPYNLSTPESIESNRKYLLQNSMNLYLSFMNGIGCDMQDRCGSLHRTLCGNEPPKRPEPPETPTYEHEQRSPFA